MIYITGDTHGNIDFDKLTYYFESVYHSKKDYLIILGDAGIVWSSDNEINKNYESQYSKNTFNNTPLEYFSSLYN